MLVSRRTRSKDTTTSVSGLIAQSYSRSSATDELKQEIDRSSPVFKRACIELLVSGYPDPFADLVGLIERQDESYRPAAGLDLPPKVDMATLQFTAEELKLADMDKRKGDIESVTSRLLRLGWDLFAQRGDLPTAVAMLERALGAARLCESSELELEVTSKLGGLCQRAGDYASAAALLDRCAQIAEENSLVRRQQEALAALIRLHSKLAIDCRESDDLPGAVDHVKAALSASRGAGNRKSEAACLFQLAQLQLDLHQPTDAIDLAKQYISLCESLASVQASTQEEIGSDADAFPDIGKGYACLARASKNVGKDADALAALAQYQKAAAESGDTKEQAAAKAVLGIELAKEGSGVDAVKQLRSAFDLRRGLVEAGVHGVNRSEVENTRIHLGIAKAKMIESKLVHVLAERDIQRVLKWKTTR